MDILTYDAYQHNSLAEAQADDMATRVARGVETTATLHKVLAALAQLNWLGNGEDWAFVVDLCGKQISPSDHLRIHRRVKDIIA